MSLINIIHYIVLSQGKADDTTKRIVQEPSPVKTVVKKVISALICAYIFIKFINLYPIKNIKGRITCVRLVSI